MNKLVIGLTGEIGCGKSFIAKLFSVVAEDKKIPIHNVDVDVVGHWILAEHEPTKELLIKHFDTCNRKELSNIIFADSAKRILLDEIMIQPMYSRVVELIDSCDEGIILVNGALLIETNWFEKICNGNVIVVLTPPDKQIENLLNRGYTLNNSIQRVSSQLSSTLKLMMAEKKIQEMKRGFIYKIYNYNGNEIEQINILLKKLVDKQSYINF